MKSLALAAAASLAAAQVPNRPPTYVLNQSTIIMPCNEVRGVGGAVATHARPEGCERQCWLRCAHAVSVARPVRAATGDNAPMSPLSLPHVPPSRAAPQSGFTDPLSTVGWSIIDFDVRARARLGRQSSPPRPPARSTAAAAQADSPRRTGTRARDATDTRCAT